MSPELSALVVFTPSGKRGRFPLGTPLLQAARSLGVDIDSVCGGRALCGRCQVLVMEGEFAKHGIVSGVGHLSRAGAAEQDHVSRRPLPSGRRLSCQALIEGDLVVDVPPGSQVHRQVIRKVADARAITLDPVVRLHYVEVRRPDIHDPTGDLQRLKEALQREWRLSHLQCDLQVLQSLQPVLRKGQWKVTVAVRTGSQIIGVWPGYHELKLGLAVDIGSTTVAAHLCNLSSGEVLASSGAMNPQIRFGEDLMSRVSYSMMHADGTRQMAAAVRETLNALAAEVTRQVNAGPEDILEVTLVGNPIMHHLLLGIDPVESGRAPFALATDEATVLRTADLGLNLHPNARAYVLPCVAGHVGADTAAMILSERPDLSDVITLLVDIGTNAEIVLGNRERLFACSSPTGPAFEGAQISSGQRAAPGAIERVRIDPHTLEPRFKVIGSDLWSNEPGFEASIKHTGVTGICGSGIIEVISQMYLTGIIGQDGVVDGGLAARSTRIVAHGRTFDYVVHQGELHSSERPSGTRGSLSPAITKTEVGLGNGAPPPGTAGASCPTVTITITQNDVRAIQLAKGALYASIKVLMERFGTEHVDRIRLAGAFGAHIDVKYAMLLGMIPDCDLSCVASVGNAAGTGARIALLDTGSRKTVETLVHKVKKVETAIEPRFEMHFVEAMGIPHSTAQYVHLRKAVDLPARRAT